MNKSNDGSFTAFRRVLGLLLYIPGTIIATILAERWAFHQFEKIVLSTVFGEHRYATGLRIVNKQMLLSDGTSLSGFLQFLIIGPSFATAFIAMAACFLLAAMVHGSSFFMFEAAPSFLRPVGTSKKNSEISPKRFLETSRHFQNVMAAPVRFRIDHVLRGKNPHFRTAVFGHVEEGILRPGMTMQLPTKAGGVIGVPVVELDSADGVLEEVHHGSGLVAIMIDGEHLELAESGALQNAQSRVTDCEV
jgi:hypothetical protein